MTAAGALLAPRSAARSRVRAPAQRTPDFRALLGEAAWAELPAAVRARFGAAAHAAPRDFPGAMEVRISWLGWLFAQGCRLIGTPIAPWPGRVVPVMVSVSAIPGGGVRWTRTYAYPGRAPLSIVSMKLAARDGSLLEVTRGGLGMRLALGVEAGALVFRSTSYFWRLGPWLLPIPDVLTPGRATVAHRDLGGGRFHFALGFVHPLAGETLANAGDFADPPEPPRP
ncbi:MAG TPA: DUF4166 domain-containing protein [Caulobacteraceae bacterium]|jgi:hypothetical protein